MVQVRRRFSGYDQFGHHWQNDGDVIDVADGEASQLLAEPPLPLYTLVTPGATIEAGVHDRAVGEGDPNAADPDTPGGQFERMVATGSKPEDVRLKTPTDEGQPEHRQPGAGRADPLDESPGRASSANTTEARRGTQPDDEAAGAPNSIDKTIGTEGRKVVGRGSRAQQQ